MRQGVNSHRGSLSARGRGEGEGREVCGIMGMIAGFMVRLQSVIIARARWGFSGGFMNFCASAD
jgi:hypothetical protein